jgi:chromosome segregation ATPase
MTEDQLIEFLKAQMGELRQELAQTRSDLKDVSKAMTALELHLAKVDGQNIAARQEELQKRVSQFEKQALTEEDIATLRKTVADLSVESTERKAQAKMLRWMVAALGAINLLLLIYLNWKRV